MIIKLAIALVAVLIVAASAAWAFLPARHLPATAPATCGSGCTCGCTPARASPTCLPCTCAGATSRRCAARPGSAPPSRCATASSIPASTRSSSAAPTTGTHPATTPPPNGPVRTRRAAGLAYSVDEAARLAGRSRDLLYDEMRRGDLACVKVGRRRLITRQHLRQFPGIAS